MSTPTSAKRAELLRNEAQHAVDELWNNKMIPFKLTAYMVGDEGQGIYIVHFFDSRLQELPVFWEERRTFKDAVRTAVLDSMKEPKPRTCLKV